MIEIELPCCDSPALVERLDDCVRCEACGVIVELADPAPGVLPAAA